MFPKLLQTHLVGCGAGVAFKWRLAGDELEGQHAHRPGVDGGAIPQLLTLLVVGGMALLWAAQHLCKQMAHPGVTTGREDSRPGVRGRMLVSTSCGFFCTTSGSALQGSNLVSRVLLCM